MRAVLVNAIHVLHSERDAKDAQAQLLKLIYVGGSVGPLTDKIRKLKTHLRFQRYKQSHARLFYNLPLFLHCSFLVRFFCGTDLVHTIFVDTKRGLILDSSERCPLILTSKAYLFVPEETTCDQLSLRIGNF